MTDLRIVSDAGRLAEISRLFDSGPDLIPVRDIGWLIDLARENERLRAEREHLIEAGSQLQAENERLVLADRQWADHVKRLSEDNERLRAAMRLALQYLTGGSDQYVERLEGAQPAVDTLLATLGRHSGA